MTPHRLFLSSVLLVICPQCLQASQITGPLLKDLVSQHVFGTRLYNIFTCSGQDTSGLLRTLSSTHQGLFGAHEATKPPESWVTNRTPQTFILNLHCLEALQILSQADAANLFRRPFSWVLLSHADGDPRDSLREEHDRTVIERLGQLDILVDSQVVMSKRVADGTSQLTSFYKIQAGAVLIQESLGEWSLEQGLNLHLTGVVAVRRADLRGLNIRGSMVMTHKESLDHMDDLVDKHIDSLSKVTGVLMILVMRSLNASLDLELVDSWGAPGGDGKWSGMVGSIQSRTTEITSTPLFITTERMLILEYFGCPIQTGGNFIFISPPLSYSSNIFALPFSSTVWISCLALILLSSLLLFATVKFEYKEPRVRKPKGRDIWLRDSWSDIIMVNIGAICMQGTVVEPKGPAGRMVTLFLFLSVMFLYVSYSGSIVALLQSSDTSINTLSDLLESPLGCGADDIVYSQYYFKTASEPVRKAIFDKKVAPKGKPPNFFPVEEGIARMRKGLFAYHVETSPGYHVVQKTFTEDEKCGLQELKTKYIQLTDPYVALHRNSSFTEMFKISMQRVKERGLVKRQVWRYYTKKPVCSARGSMFVSVGLVDCYHAFLWLSYGMILAFVSMLLENVVHLRYPNLVTSTNRKKTARIGEEYPSGW